MRPKKKTIKVTVANGQHRCKEFWQWKQWGWNKRKHYFLQNVISLNSCYLKEVRVKYANWIFKQDESFLGPLISPITLTNMTGMWLLSEAGRNSHCHHQCPLKAWTIAHGWRLPLMDAWSHIWGTSRTFVVSEQVPHSHTHPHNSFWKGLPFGLEVPLSEATYLRKYWMSLLFSSKNFSYLLA